MDEVTLTLNSPMTEEQWDMIVDHDFNYTNEIIFHTCHGKTVRFVKESAQPERKKGKWLRSGSEIFPYECDQCGETNERTTPWCPHCGADMRSESVRWAELGESLVAGLEAGLRGKENG